MHFAGVKYRAASTLLRLSTDGTHVTTLEEELPVLCRASGEKVHVTAIAIFAMEEHTSTTAQSLSDAGRSDTARQTLAEFIAAQFADTFCQDAA